MPIRPRALICGASQGIGRATALALAATGAHVTLLARDAQALEAVQEAILARGGAAGICVADLDDLDLGAVPADVNIVVHNTGGPPGGLLRDASREALLAAFTRHVLSAQALLQHTLPFMEAEGFGRWVNVLSTSVREPIDNLGVSNLTRAAMASWSKTLSRELAPGVTINNVLPGYTDTDRLSSLAQGRANREGSTADQVREAWLSGVPEGRLGRPEEIADVISFVCSPAASYLRGQSIAVDGGRLRSL